jgi:hypothetical protein
MHSHSDDTVEIIKENIEKFEMPTEEVFKKPMSVGGSSAKKIMLKTAMTAAEGIVVANDKEKEKEVFGPNGLEKELGFTEITDTDIFKEIDGELNAEEQEIADASARHQDFKEQLAIRNAYMSIAQAQKKARDKHVKSFGNKRKLKEAKKRKAREAAKLVSKQGK